MGEMQAGEAGAAPSQGLISRVLSPAVQHWLKSQVDRIDQLEVKINARDRQLLSGTIPQLTLAAAGAVYQGLHLSQVDLSGSNIRVNLKQVVQGKPLQLLEPIPVEGTISLTTADLNASLAAPLLADAVKLFLLDLLQSGAIDASTNDPDLNLQNLQVRLSPDQLILRADLISQTQQSTEIALRSGLCLVQPNRLALNQPEWLPHFNAKRGLSLKELEGYTFNLGEAHLSELAIIEGELRIVGKLWVRP